MLIDNGLKMHLSIKNYLIKALSIEAELKKEKTKC